MSNRFVATKKKTWELFYILMTGFFNRTFLVSKLRKNISLTKWNCSWLPVQLVSWMTALGRNVLGTYRAQKSAISRPSQCIKRRWNKFCTVSNNISILHAKFFPSVAGWKLQIFRLKVIVKKSRLVHDGTSSAHWQRCVSGQDLRN